MSERSKKVKRPQGKVCTTCGQPLLKRTIVRAEGKSPRKILMDGILAALDAGPASPREIEKRMGFKPHGSDTANFLRILERRGAIQLVGQNRNAIGGPTFVWERTTDSEKETPRPQPIERALPNHKDSKRGARP